ncbi:carboxylesterase family protein [Novosphingobium sp.]|uniref:carboxylesterase/lipase family protein n=1 Tax=Novosphingobium sp. TaxID=1874826 RepID=UPI0031D4A882
MRRIRFASIIFALTCGTPALADALPDRLPDALSVTAPAGAVHGMAIDGVRSFRGIPFAQPPVGALRWREPQPLAPWTGVREATQWSPRCKQTSAFADMRFRSSGDSEDCLYLNIWTPAGAKPGDRLPVLFYVYGGGFVAGAADESRYDGAAMAKKGIVVVVANYRVGSFGFFAHPELTAESPHHASGNQGLLDQVAALQWTRANIAAFGGNPQHITINGESAGSFSMSVLTVSPLSRDLIVGVIAESGAAVEGCMGPVPLQAAEARGTELGQTLGATSLAALRALPADTILASRPNSGSGLGLSIDGYLLPQTLDATYAAHQAAHVPAMIGSNSQDTFGNLVLGSETPTLAHYREGVTKLFGANAETVLKLYPAASDAQVLAASTELSSDHFLGQPTWKWFDLHRQSGEPTYYFRYNHIRPPANGLPAPAMPVIGAVHSAEIEYALGNLDVAGVSPLYTWTQADRQMSTLLQGYFVNFIKSGNPNGPGLPAWKPAGTTSPLWRQEVELPTKAKPFTDEARYRAMDRIAAQP